MSAGKFNIHSFEERLEAKNRFDGNLRHGAKEFHARTNRSGVGRPSSGYLTAEHAKVVIDRGIERHVRKAGLWEAVPQCPVCDSAEREPFLTRRAVDIYRCGNCSHRYMDPRVKHDAMTEAADRSPAESANDEALHLYGLDLVAQLDPPRREKLMAFGSGAALFVQIAERNGWGECIAGEEYDEYSITLHLGRPNASIDKMDSDQIAHDYDAIFLWSMLEQSYHPHALLARLAEMLRPRALMLVVTPNADSLAVRLLRDRSPIFHWRNPSLFTPRSLQRLAADHALQSVHFETVISDLDVIKSYMSGEPPRHGFRDREGMFDAITPEFIHHNLLGSSMIGVFRRS